MTPLKSQILGLLLAFSTAIGCIFYEKLVHNFSFNFFMVVKGIEFIIICLIGYFTFNSVVVSDYQKLTTNPVYYWHIVGYIATGVTTLLWFKITQHQGVMVGSIYEIKYVIMLALIYIIFGDNNFTFNTAVGLIFAILSVYFISKS